MPAQFPLSLAPAFWSDAAVKFAVLLLALFAFSLTACNTLATRRALYSPAKASGPYTKYRKHGGRLPPTNLPRVPVEPPGGVLVEPIAPPPPPVE